MALPISVSKEEFIRQLRAERLLVVIGETGSGKTTRVPQYASEALEGLVVCTQAHEATVVRIADRIAFEIDGAPPGQSVGHDAGSGAVPGRKIRIVTEAAFVGMARADPLLSEVAVLVIDDAHERHLSTDLVAGIAKRILERRTDFRVIVASAPVDVLPIHKFFAGASSAAVAARLTQPSTFRLKRDGPSFPVAIEECPLAEDADDVDGVLVREVNRGMSRVRSGHCLVFVASESQARVVERRLAATAAPNLTVLPLRDDLSPSEWKRVLDFDDGQGAHRLVAVCVGAAAVVRDVRLVVDSGLSDEWRYDADRDVTVQERVRVSKWIAERRCALAGFTAPSGHCIRLYSWATVDRRDVDAEIRRSSLEWLVLQICSLQLDPFAFDYVERPERSRLQRATEWLKRHALITQTRFRLTDRGMTLMRLPFDPRTGHFVLSAHERYGQGTAALAVAVLLGLANSIFDGESDEEVATTHPTLSSDLEHFLFLFRAWLSAGIGLQCGHSERSSNARCPACCTEYAAERRLNLPVLERVQSATASLRSVLGDAPTGGAKVPVAEALGRCLSEAFPDRIAEFVLPSNPAAGIHLLTSGLSGQLAASSILSAGVDFFVASSLTRATSGRLVANLAHPVDSKWLPTDVLSRIRGSQLDVTACYCASDVHSRYADRCFRLLRDQKLPFAIPVYDGATATVTVYSPRAQADRVAALCRSEVDALRRRDLKEESVTVDCRDGRLELTVGAGMRVRNLEETGEACRVLFTDPPVTSDAELLEWVCSIARTTPPNVRWHRYRDADDDDPSPVPVGVVVFHRKEAAALARSNCPETVSTQMARTGVYGVVRLTTDVENVAEVLVQHGFKPLNVQIWQPRTQRCEIRIRNVPPSVAEAKLKAIVRPAPASTSVRPSERYPTCYDATLTFTDGGECREAVRWLRCSPLLTRPHSLPTSSGDRLQLRVDIAERIETEPAEYLASFDEPETADRLYAERDAVPLLNVDGFGTVTVRHPELYDLTRHAEAIADFHGVGFRSSSRSDGTYRVVFQNGRPSRCVEAAEAFRNITEPIRYSFHDCEKEAMGRELRSGGVLDLWALDLRLRVEEYHVRKRFVGFAVYGEQYRRGRFMARLADYHSAFVRRYLTVSLSPWAGGLFQPGRRGDSFLEKLDGCRRARFDPEASVVEIVVADGPDEPSEVLERCRATLDDFLSSCHQPSGMAVKCVYCHHRAGTPFAICGHRHCRVCLERAVQSQVAPFSGQRLTRPEAERLCGDEATTTVRCPSCLTPVAAKDVVAGLSASTLDQVCTALALLHVYATDHPIAPCPVPSCKGLVRRGDGYAPCPSCRRTVCPLCATVDDERHLSVTCDEYRDILENRFRFDIAKLTASAERYARDHWRQFCSGCGQIQSIEVNPGLELGCMALQRYCLAIKHLAIKDLDRDSIFAWHGTSETALPMICNDGFDPQRRSGQSFGRGEYFGISAQTSIGYNRGSNLLIVAQLLKCNQLSTHSNFCYVVDNPVDWSHAFNLPVLVVIYGTSMPRPIPWIRPEKRPLPKLFDSKVRKSLWPFS